MLGIVKQKPLLVVKIDQTQLNLQLCFDLELNIHQAGWSIDSIR